VTRESALDGRQDAERFAHRVFGARPGQDGTRLVRDNKKVGANLALVVFGDRGQSRGVVDPNRRFEFW